ncbi:G-type lectin S-receptor-like serine/threonine-protein kinase SD3-1 isoform X2 [Neltuma alba]|uniref:G-type lectin S-receptor-like serine/threonine-protein kinase SD3-1 isoform X2 n=1 Tax=Neltuma alba TaxID=207710 RepID=UPI0010A3D391|nr:G-type lectin S-receptor-like serine/threonine-protein kinase SD3-1 isoform X2 [Prosopis alba]
MMEKGFTTTELCFLRPPFLLCIFAGFLLNSFVIAEIPLGSKLLVADNDCWVSSNGDFALGFFNISDQPNLYSIGIHYNSKSIPTSQQTVVWTAGADITVGNESYFHLTQQGELILFDSLRGIPIWTSKTGNRSIVSAALRDNGNLVLLDKEQNTVWQSFDDPSDTLLPGQSLYVNQTLRAASKNSLSSYYSLDLNASGQLQLRWESSIVYWVSNSPSTSNLSAFLTPSGAVQLRQQSLKPVWSVFGEDHNDSVNYRFLRLDSDGNLRLYSWIETAQLWRTVWQAVENQCKVFATCGQRGICGFTASGATDCRCPFELTDSINCMVPYKECESGSIMLTFKNTFLYGTYPPDESVIISSLQQCEQLCLNDFQCTFATYFNNGSGQCSLRKTPYVTGYADPSLSSISFVKRCSDPLAVNPNPKQPPPSEQPMELCLPCLIGAASGTFFIFAMVQLGIGFCIYKRKGFTGRKTATLGLASPHLKGLAVLSFSEIKSLTGDFRNQIGPTMFKGLMPNNHLVTIINLNAFIEERKFRGAVMKMGSIQHKDLAKLEGYCCEFNHRFMVYEYAKNGSLGKYIDDSTLCKKLTWRKRLDICSTVAKAIYYLHTGCREFVSHGNLECENVMLDENLTAKVTDFGFARIDGQASYCGFSAEKDVEDFGKLVLTLLSGSRNHEEIRDWAYREWKEGRVENVFDRRIEGGMEVEELERALRIAFWCIQMDDRMRPSMGEVVRVLDGNSSVDAPPHPFAFQKPLHEDDEAQEYGSESEV